MLHKLGELELTIDLLNEQVANLMGVELAPGLASGRMLACRSIRMFRRSKKVR